MRSPYRYLLLLTVLVLIASGPARANHVDKGMSGLGDVNPTTGCAAGIGVPCVVFNITAPNQTATWESFNTPSNGDSDGPYEFFEVPTSAPVTFQLSNLTGDFGNITCGFSPETIIDLQGFCTTIGEENDSTIEPNTFLTAGSLVENAGGQVTLAFTGVLTSQAAAAGLTSFPSYWVFYAPEGSTILSGGTTGGGGTTPVPEPASLFLLGSGLLAFGAYKRRKSSRDQAQEPAAV